MDLEVEVVKNMISQKRKQIKKNLTYLRHQITKGL